MGFDVHGKDPSAPEGEYFRNNSWWWRPLWDYCREIAPDLISEELWQMGHFNDGEGLGAESSSKLAFRLKGAIAEGHTARYEKAVAARLAALPKLPCNYCDATGVRTDAIGVANGFDKRKWCNGCNGTGKHEHPDSMYPFSEENAKNFATFLESCGGFEIT